VWVWVWLWVFKYELRGRKEWHFLVKIKRGVSRRPKSNQEE